MAVLNQVLGSPENGWTRYNDNNTSLTYESLNYIYLTEAMNVYQSDIHILRNVGDKVKFNISGTGFRIISSTYPGQADVKVLIDGIESGTYTQNKSQGSLILLYEKTGLENKEHSVVLEKTNGGDFIFDALDVQGELKEYKLPPVNKYLFKDGEEIKKYDKTSFKDAVPKMTMMIQNGITLSSSSYLGTGSRAVSLFDDELSAVYDGSDYLGWSTSWGVKTGWVQIDFDEAKKVEKYTLTAAEKYYKVGSMAKSWSIQVSNDNLNWIAVSVISNEINWGLGEKREFDINNADFYKHYKINVTANNGDSELLSIGEMELLERSLDWEIVGMNEPSKELFDLHGMTDLSLINDEAMQQLSSDRVELLCWTDEAFPIRKSKIEALPTQKILVSNKDMSSSEVNQIYMESQSRRVFRNTVPALTSNTSGGGEAFTLYADPAYSSTYTAPWKAFNGINLDQYNSMFNTYSSGSIYHTGKLKVGYDFKKNQKISAYSISINYDIGQSPKVFTLEGWYEDRWVVIDSQTVENWVVPDKKIFILNEDQTFSKYQLNVTSSGGSGFVRIGELELLEEIGKSGEVKITSSHDGGTTWMGKAQVDITDLASVKANGFTPEELNALTKEQITTLFPNGTARFAFYLEQENLSDVVEIQSLSVGEKQYTISPTATDLSLIYEVLQEEKPTLYASRDDGVSWKEIGQDEMASLSEQPEGNSLRVKAVLKNGQEIHAMSYAWS